ncbi:MAG: Integral rane protein [Frankiales bacterium]|nr:Integral rane protein [Frankiales bacterium]
MTEPPRLPFLVRALRKVAAYEAISFVLLMLGAAMKRTSDLDPQPVFGALHGTLFLLLVALVLLTWRWHRWGFLFTLLVCTALSPGAHFAVQATVEQRSARHAARGPARRTAADAP